MAKKSPFLVQTSQFWSVDPINPSRDVAFIGELITLKDTPSISNRFAARVPPALKKNTSWPISPLYSIYIQKKVLDQNKMSQTHLKPFNGRQWNILQSILGVLHPFRGLWKAPKPYFDQKLTVFDPPCQPGPIFLAQNAFKICPIDSSTSFDFKSHL